METGTLTTQAITAGEAIDQARRLLTPPEERASPWAALGAAALAATTAIVLACVVVVGPGVDLERMAVVEQPR